MKKIKVEKKQINKQVKKEVKILLEDRSAFNCPDCKGTGLKDSFNLCDNCKGTGKI